MNFRTTFVLLVLVAAGAVIYLLEPRLAPALRLASEAEPTSPGDTTDVLRNKLSPEHLQRIEVKNTDPPVILEKGPDGKWTMPGKWPTRTAEVMDLVNLIGGFQTRFAPFALGDPPDLDRFGLKVPEVKIDVTAGDKTYELTFGEHNEESGDRNRFSWPTYVRVDSRPEVVRLAPGLIPMLERPADYYQQRRLFAGERVAKEFNPQEKVEQLSAQEIAAKEGASNEYKLSREGEDWTLLDPTRGIRDHTDPDKLKTVLTAIPDIWVEQFEKQKKNLSEYALDKPEKTLIVTGASGQPVTLLIGKMSRMKTHTILRPAPNMGGPPMPPQEEVVHEEFRFAKLQGNDQVFEVKAEKLKDIFVSAESLRDSRLARFKTEDVRGVNIKLPGQEIVLAKDRDTWRVQKPFQKDADSSKVTELLDKLNGLQARDKDILDKADLKTYALDKPARTISVTYEETSATPAKTDKAKTTKTIVFELGKDDAAAAKVYVRVAGWERVNAVEDSLLKLVERPALAYRGRRVLDFETGDLAKIEIKNPAETYTLDQVNGEWKLASPVSAAIDSSLAGQLAGDLNRLEATEYITDTAAPDALETRYGLGKPAITAKVLFSQKPGKDHPPAGPASPPPPKPSETLLIGKERTGKPEYFAKLASAPGIFTVSKEIHDALNRDSLAYRSLQLWQLAADDVGWLHIQKAGSDYTLKRDGQAWKIAGPFDAVAMGDLVRPMTDELSNLRAKRFITHADKDSKSHGLEKPYLQVTLQEVVKPAADKKNEKPTVKERRLSVGKIDEKDPQARYAKLSDSPAVFLLEEKVVTAIDHGALDLLDKNLLTLDGTTIAKIERAGLGGMLSLERDKGEWRVIKAGIPPFTPDQGAVAALIGPWTHLRAERLAAYGTSVKLADYGLDKPDATITVTSTATATSPGKPVAHVLTLGKPVSGSSQERYAQLDHGAAVAVLSPAIVKELTQSYLEFVKRSVLTLEPSRVSAIRREMGGSTLELATRETGWRMIKPSDQPADDQILFGLVDALSALRAKEVAAYPVGDLKPFGLDKPTATLTLSVLGAEGQVANHVIKIGKAKESDRYALVDNSNAVVVLPSELAGKLLADPLQFHNHNLARFFDADRVMLERDTRKAIFVRADAGWKMTQPVEEPAEAADLDEFVNSVARLRADELVADKPADLKPYGLDHPRSHWRFMLGERVVLDMIVGKPERIKEQGKEKDGPRLYAKIAASPTVFLLSAQLSSRALAEYRNRAPWTGLDAAQVERLSYGYPQRSFILDKVGETWQIPAQTDLKVKPEAVRETLDALAGLKVERYIVDKDADLKLYGLQPPQLTLDVQSRAGGKQVLNIGRAEGDTKKLYASVGDAKQGAVFVISEADAAKIVRALSAFTQDPTKAVLRMP